MTREEASYTCTCHKQSQAFCHIRLSVFCSFSSYLKQVRLDFFIFIPFITAEAQLHFGVPFHIIHYESVSVWIKILPGYFVSWNQLLQGHICRLSGRSKRSSWRPLRHLSRLFPPTYVSSKSVSVSLLEPHNHLHKVNVSPYLRHWSLNSQSGTMSTLHVLRSKQCLQYDCDYKPIHFAQQWNIILQYLYFIPSFYTILWRRRTCDSSMHALHNENHIRSPRVSTSIIQSTSPNDLHMHCAIPALINTFDTVRHILV